MNQQGFDLIATNVVVMQSIFQYLNFKEQLKFAQVSQHLKYIFSNVIWKVDYSKICIIKDPPDFHVKNETDLNKLKLTSKEFAEFVKLYGHDIKELNEKCNPWLDIRKFPNLTSLSYSNMRLTKPQLQTVAKYCKQLVKLSISTCSNKSKDMFELPRDLEIKTLVEMKKLKWLYVASCIQLPLKYKHFKEIIIKSNIKHLNLKFYIASDERLQMFNKHLNNSLEELEISTTFREVWWKRNFPCYLSHFENLLILTLNDADAIDDATLQVLANTCRQLKKLSINFTTFENVSKFHLLSSIEELNLQICEGLTHTNLRQILSAMNLIKFSSLQTKYEGTFENFPLSNKIQSLNIHLLKTYEFKGAYEENDNLRSLIWYDDIYKPAMEPLSFKCANLENLQIYSGFIALDIVLQLTSLRSLCIEHPTSNVTWSYITQLLRNHNSLTEFTLENLCSGLDSESSPKEAFECAANMKSIKISPHVFGVAIDFWLDLLNKNPELKLICLGLFTSDFVRNLLNSSKFPAFLKTIYIHGFKVACKDLRKNFDYIMEKINSYTHLPIQAAYENKFGIIF